MLVLQRMANDVTDERTVFAHCFERVDPLLYATMLMEDMCLCVNGGNSIEHCRTFAEPIFRAYASVCVQAGLIMEWRSPTFFREHTLINQFFAFLVPIFDDVRRSSDDTVLESA